jgi:N-acetylmuramoyl-L-alanine amidase/Putative peptidoglycan binding domain
MAFSLTWLPEVLENAGLKVAEQPGWRTRGRGEMGDVKGVMCHHTSGPPDGNMPSLGVVTHGRPDLAGPLAQLCLGRDGTFYVVAAGRCNHAGKGNWQGITTGNSSFIGIEAENTGLTTGPHAEPWPPVQLDAYRRGVAAIVARLNANAIMCVGHKEYALPHGRKDDPTFDMFDFRNQVAAIMAGHAPLPSIIPAVDGDGRPTLRRGDRGDLVRQIQAQLGVTADGMFGGRTEAALRQFQRDHGLIPDGIAGPRTWASLGSAGPAAVAATPPPPAAHAPAQPSAVPVQPAEPLPAPAQPSVPVDGANVLDPIIRIAAESDVARLNWKGRGVAPAGYVKGMAAVYARVYCKLKEGDPAAEEMAKAKTGDAAHDALAWYDGIFAAAGMSNDVEGIETLRHLFVLLIGLGMRESSGKYCEGRDEGADNREGDTAEAGLFQMSYNARVASPLMPKLFTEYAAKPYGFIDIFKECVECTPDDLENYGSGDGLQFQKLAKACPAFAAEFAAVGLRNIRKHWGPINKRAAEVRPECSVMLQKVEEEVDRLPAAVVALLV